MQLVLDEKGKRLAKGQRALRAYCNLEKPPAGFKGNPFVDGETRIERELTPFHLSRYLYARSLLEESLFGLVEFEKQDGNDRNNRKARGPKKIFTRGDIERHKKDLENGRADCNEDGGESKKKEMDLLSSIDNETLKRMNRIYDRIIAEFMGDMDGLSIDLSEPENIDNIIRDVRSVGNGLTSSYLLCAMRDFLTDGVDEKDRNAVAILMALIYFEIKETSCARYRITFDKGETDNWRILRRKFLMLSAEDVYTALRKAGATEPDPDKLTKDKIQRLIRLHGKYATLGRLDLDDHDFLYEASPFAEKPVGSPIGNFELAVYPTNGGLDRLMRLIADPTFEHADGAIALAAFTILENRLILEEVQSDVPDLLRRSALDGEVSELRKLTEDWQSIALAAARHFARKNGFSEFFASTPWRIFWKYMGSMHPDKARVYFERMEKLGGQLVYDEQGQLGLRQYYYRFEA